MTAGRAGAAFGAVPRATLAEAGGYFRFYEDGSRGLARQTLTAPAFAAGASLAVDGVNQQVFAALHEAMLEVAGTTGAPALIQPLMPCLTL